MLDFKEAVRAANPIERLAAEHITLKNNVGLSPFRKEKTASFRVFPKTQSYCDFGDGSAGDVFDFIMRIKGMDFKTALNYLAARASITPPTWTPEQKQTADKRQAELDALNKAVDKFHQALTPPLAAYQKLTARGITPETIKEYKIGWDSAAGRVTLPVFRYGKPIYLIRWWPDKSPKYLFPRDQEKPVVGVEYLKDDGCLIVEGIFCWLSLIQAGFSAACILGKNPSKENQLEPLKKANDLILMLDGDAPGKEAADDLAELLFPKGRIATLPDGLDPNNLAVKLGDVFKQEIEKLAGEAKSLLDRRIDHLNELDIKTGYATNFIFPLVAKLEPLEKERYQNLLKTVLKVGIGAIRDAVNEAAPVEIETPPEVDKALLERGHAFAEMLSDSPLDEVAALVRRSGVTGEDQNVKLLYLSLTSRLLTKPVSIAVKGVSSGGKSWTAEKTIELFPDSAYIARTGLSPHALAYSDEDFSHRTLVIFEAAGLGDEGDYLLRSLLSEGRLLYETVESTNAGLRSKVIEKPGPTNCIITTTRVSLHPENETRLLSLSVNDSNEQTAAVLRHTAKPPEPIDLSDWQAFQSWLSTQSNEVVIPYAETLAGAMPPVAVRLRRDFSQLLSLIKTHAILCQAKRERDDQGRIIATLDDYETVRALVLPVMSEGVQATVKDAIRETVNKVGELARGEDITTYRAVAERMNLDESSVRRRVREAIARGYILNLETRPRQRAKLKLGDPLPDEIVLLPEKTFFNVSLGDLLAQVPKSEEMPGSDSQTLRQAPLHKQTQERMSVNTCADLGKDHCTSKIEDITSSEDLSRGLRHLGTDIPGTDAENKIYAATRERAEDAIDSYWQGNYPVLSDDLCERLADMRERLNIASTGVVTEREFQSLCSQYLFLNTKAAQKNELTAQNETLGVQKNAVNSERVFSGPELTFAEGCELPL